MKADYRIRMSNGEEFLLNCDMTQASAGIWTNWSGDEDGWTPLPYQTADARHDVKRAAQLANDYAATEDDEREAKVVSVTALDEREE